MTQPKLKAKASSGEAGFTLVEALVAMVVLIFGIMAVTNLMVVAASSNSVANQTTAAAASATQVLDTLRATAWPHLTTGGLLDADATTTVDCRTLSTPVGATTVPVVSGKFACFNDVPGVGRVINRWRIGDVTGVTGLRFIEVQSESTGALGARRSRAYFTAFRSCTLAECS